MSERNARRETRQDRGSGAEQDAVNEIRAQIMRPEPPMDWKKYYDRPATRQRHGSESKLRVEIPAGQEKNAGEIYAAAGVMIDSHQSLQRRLEAAWDLASRYNVGQLQDGKGNTYKIKVEMTFQLDTTDGTSQSVSVYKNGQRAALLEGLLVGPKS